jgi:hypothetical protein
MKAALLSQSRLGRVYAPLEKSKAVTSLAAALPH